MSIDSKVTPSGHPDDWKQVKPSVRPELSISAQRTRGRPCFVVEDPIQGKFFRLGTAEHALMLFLDGKTTMEVAIKKTREQHTTFDEERASKFLRWLIANRLIRVAGQRFSGPDSSSPLRGVPRWSLLATRIPLCNPDRVLQHLTPTSRWIFSRPMVAVTSVLMLVAILRVWSQWHEVELLSRTVFSRDSWLLFAACLLVLKLAHELAHGIVCKKYGGSIPEAGIVFMFFVPLAYVDATSSWRFSSRWQRIHVAAAGMYIELLVGAIAAIIWSISEAGLLKQTCFQLMASVALTTIVFNGNPLMRFDGYYILADWLDIPNLYIKGRQWVADSAAAAFLGVVRQYSFRSEPRWIVAGYGIAAAVWRVFFMVGLMAFFASAFYGAGLVAAAAVLFSWFLKPSLDLTKHLLTSPALTRTQRLRCVLISSFLLILAGGSLLVPLAPPCRTCAVVEHEPLATVRAGSAGFIRALHVSSGQFVESGHTLLTLDNPTLRAELRGLELSVAQADLRIGIRRREQQLAELQSEEKDRAALIEKLADKRRQCDQLVVRAPISGHVFVRRGDELLGTYAEQGQVLLTMGHQNQKRLRVAIHQDHQIASDARQVSMRVLVPGRAKFATAMSRIEPQATVVPPHRSLCAPYGGALPIIAAPQQDEESGEVRLLEPHFSGFASIPTELCRQLRAGQRATVLMRTNAMPLGRHIARWWTGRVLRGRYGAAGESG